MGSADGVVVGCTVGRPVGFVDGYEVGTVLAAAAAVAGKHSVKEAAHASHILLSWMKRLQQ